MTGPFFEHDPARTFADNAADMMRAFGVEGELRAKAEAQGIGTGTTRRQIRGRARANAGESWRATAIVGIPQPIAAERGAIRSYAALATLERVHRVMSRTANALRRSRAVNTAELTKGL